MHSLLFCFTPEKAIHEANVAALHANSGTAPVVTMYRDATSARSHAHRRPPRQESDTLINPSPRLIIILNKVPCYRLQLTHARVVRHVKGPVSGCGTQPEAPNVPTTA